MNESDLELLSRYCRDRVEDAFAEIVRRHLDWVYSAAYRQVRSRELAQEITQSVFVDLARQARNLGPGTLLTAWLYQVTRRTSIDVIRREARRIARERHAAEMNTTDSPPSDWTSIEPLLEEALDTLNDAERAAVLLRFFQNKSLRDVGLALGVSEEAARKRVDRAVERLGVFLTRHGATAGPGALASFIAANAVQAAPAGLMASVCASAAPIGMLPVSAAISLTKTVAMTTLQKTLVSAAIAISAALVSYLTYEVSSERSQLRQLHIEQADLARQIDPLRRERDDAINAAALAHNEAERLRRDNAQVVRLRGDLGRMTTELSQAKASGTNRVSAVSAEVAGWIDRGDIIKQWFQDHPDKSIPELRLLWNENWLFAARDNKTIATNRNEGNTIDMIASNLRQESKNLLANILGHALSLYVANHNGQLPANLSDLIPYTPRQGDNPITETPVTSAEPVDETMLARYELRYTEAISQVPADESIIAETTPVDPSVDLLLQIKANGYAYTSVGIRDMYAEQLHRWSDKDAARLKPFLKK